jgi:biopolymer transport protein ExbB
VLLGPAALFVSENGEAVGTAEETLNSPKPTVKPFKEPADTKAARQLVQGADGQFPLDPTLGNAHKVASAQTSLWGYFQKGGVVMYPIAALAAVSLLVALYKWVALSLMRKPSQKQIDALVDAVQAHDEDRIKQQLTRIKGVTGKMLAAGVEHVREPRELIEEVMYERVLATRLKVQRLLPFIAVTASASPLLGLLGTVIGIINTFELITAFGTGDVQTLSGGISEALVTTMFGLIVAIPSLLLYAFLSRKARGITDQMERAALAFANAVASARTETSREPVGSAST